MSVERDGASRGDARGPRLRIVAVNDVYLLDALPRLRSLVRARSEARDADLTITTLAGDFLSPSLLSSIDQGAGMVDCLNAVPITHACLGNHEQDLPFDALVKRVQEFKGTWINTNIPTLEPALPRSQVLVVQGGGARAVRVGLVGGVTEDPSLYRPRPFGGNEIGALNATLLSAASELSRDEGCVAVIAMTHQSIERDEALARAQGAPPIPVILGGHEHDVHVEQVGTAWIVKAGSDAHYAAVIDLSWPTRAPDDGPDLPSVSVSVERVGDQPDDPSLRARVERHLAAVRDLASAVLMRLAPGESLSSIGARTRQTSVGALVTTKIRDALGADLCVVNGGGVRGQREYLDAFTFGDLDTELPFPNEVVVVEMPGAVIESAIVQSRARAPLASPAFLQVDHGVSLRGDHTIASVGGAPFDPAKTYRVATVRVLFDGLDGITSLLRYREAHPERVPSADSGRELKLIVLEAFAIELWQSLGGFDAVDLDRDARISVDELRTAAERVTKNVPHPRLLDGVLKLLDRDRDGSISAIESHAIDAAGRPV